MRNKYLVAAILVGLAVVKPLWADISEISQKAVQILRQDRPSDFRELVRLKKPALVALSKVGMQQRLVLKEETKPSPDPKTLNAQKARLARYREESKKWETPYLNKRGAVVKAIMAEITKSYALAGAKREEANLVVEMSVDNEVEILAMEQVELAGIKNLPQKVVGSLKQDHPSDLEELVGLKLSGLKALDKLHQAAEGKTGGMTLEDDLREVQKNIAETQKIQALYERKLEDVSRSVLAKIMGDRALQGEPLRILEYEVEKAIDEEAIRLALDLKLKP